MSGKSDGKGKGVSPWLISLAVIAILAVAGAGGMYLYLDYILDQRIREGFSSGDLKAPLRGDEIYREEVPPTYIRGGMAPQYSCKLSWPVDAEGGNLVGYEGFGAMFNFQLENTGDVDIYVEKVMVRTSWGQDTTRGVGRYVPEGEKKKLCQMHLPIPDPAPSRNATYDVKLDILVNGSLAWVRKSDVKFQTSNLEIKPLLRNADQPEIERNTYYLYDKIVPRIKEDRERLRSILNENSFPVGENLTIQHLVDIFDFVKEEIDYIEDSGATGDEWFSPCETLDRGGGDCEDWAMLYSGLVSVMGGTSRVVITEGHAFSAVYIGKNDAKLNDIENRFATEVPFQLYEDDLGIWLIVEPQSKLSFGWPPIDVRPTEANNENMYVYGYDGIGWVPHGSNIVSIVDIYLS